MPIFVGNFFRKNRDQQIICFGEYEDFQIMWFETFALPMEVEPYKLARYYTGIPVRVFMRF